MPSESKRIGYGVHNSGHMRYHGYNFVYMCHKYAIPVLLPYDTNIQISHSNPVLMQRKDIMTASSSFLFV